jgi:hypothetical protein
VVQLEAYSYFRNLYSVSAQHVTGVNTLINYGNGTIVWYNRTSVPAVSNLYDLTLNLTGGNVEAAFYGPPYNEHFVTAINGVGNHSPYYWTLWLYCQNKNGWEVSPVGADNIRVGSAQTIAWAYEIPYHSPLPGTQTFDSCQ